MNNKFLLVVGTAIALCSTTAAVAVDRDVEQISKIVRYGDLDLATPVGIKALNGRVRRAAVEICDTHDPMMLRELQLERRCVRAAVAGAQRQVQLAVARVERQRYARAKYLEIASSR